MDLIIQDGKKHETSEAVAIFEGFSSYDIMDVFMEADVEVPNGERFYDPIFEEVWG